MQLIATRVARSVICVSLFVLGTPVSPAKMDKKTDPDVVGGGRIVCTQKFGPKPCIKRDVGLHCRHMRSTIERSVCSGDAALL